MLKIHELTGQDGQLVGVFLRLVESEASPQLELVDVDGPLPIPPGALERVMARYGAPFDAEARIMLVDELELGAGQRLRQVRHLAGYDVIARDYLVLETGSRDAEALCALATTVAGALQHLARAHHSARLRLGVHS